MWVALTPEQFQLPKMLGKATDARAAGFAHRHGGLFHVELEALPAAELHRFYDAALADLWDEDVHEDVLAQEAKERELEAGGLN